MAAQHSGFEPGETKLSARLPRLTLDVTHGRLPEGDGERLTITIEATPSFAAFAHLLDTGNFFASWMQAMQLAWFPWLAVQRLAVWNRPTELPLRELGADAAGTGSSDVGEP